MMWYKVYEMGMFVLAGVCLAFSIASFEIYEWKRGFCFAGAAIGFELLAYLPHILLYFGG